MLVSLLRSGVVGSFIAMASIEDLWSRFSLTEEEESGADVPRKNRGLHSAFSSKVFHKASG